MYIVIGTVTKPQGIKGEVKIIAYTDDVKRFNYINHLYIDKICYDVESIRACGNDVFIKFKSINNRSDAEALRGKDIQIPYENITKPKEKDRYLICDLISSKVISNGKELGTLINILQYGTADVYVVEGERNFMFPALKDLIINVDINKKIIELEPRRLSEVIVYED